MKIKLANIYVDDQDKALRFYTEVLGFTSGATAASARQRCVRPDCAQRDPELGDADPAPQNRTPANPIPA